jgi:DDE superfamily endonuclease
VCTAHSKGKVHDFRIFKHSKTRIQGGILLLGDKGYQGVVKLHANSQTPHKKPRGKDLCKADRQSNRNLAQRRIIIEHVNRRLKIFRILAERYRNRRKRFGLRFNLLAGLYNFELKLAA